MQPAFAPLRGIRVVDLTTSLAGPYCSEILAAFGADVIKVEHADGGDEARTWGPPFAGDGQGVLFLAANASKRSFAVRLRDPEGVEAVRRVIDRAQVAIVSLRPGLAEKRGLGPDELRARNPELVYCTIGAFGREGPLSDEPGYDPLIQAASGIVSITGDPDRPGVRVGASVVDLGTGVWAALGILAAIHEGGGRVLDLSLWETALNMLSYQVTGYLATGQSPGRHGTAFPLIAPYEVFATRDGELMIAAGNDRLWESLRRVLGLADEPRFATNPERVRNRDALVDAISGRLREDDSAAWLERLRDAGVPAAPVQTVGEAADHPQTRALDLIQELGAYSTVALPLSVDGTRVRHRSPAPALGEHTAEILAEAGYADVEVRRLAERGVVLLPE